jgi:hypothetical protein
MGVNLPDWVQWHNLYETPERVVTRTAPQWMAIVKGTSVVPNAVCAVRRLQGPNSPF